MNHGTHKLHGLGHFIIKLIKYVAKMSWNDYPRYTRNKVFKHLEKVTCFQSFVGM